MVTVKLTSFATKIVASINMTFKKKVTSKYCEVIRHANMDKHYGNDEILKTFFDIFSKPTGP